MRILVVEPLKTPYIKEIDGTLEAMQKVVGGLIQVIYPFEDKTIALVCNDEGKLLNLPLNRSLKNIDGNIYDIIAGTFFLCSAKTNTESFDSLSKKEMETYQERFKNIEIYIKG